MTHDPLNELLKSCDELVASDTSLERLEAFNEIESAEIRELGRIVVETNTVQMPVYSTT
jgi:hypothetical protein